jgi:5'(3')-deoxyribonucleotidase
MKGKSGFIIGLDLDGVCYDFMRTANYMLRRRISARHSAVPEVLTRPWRYWDEPIDYTPPDDWKWLWTDGVKDGLFRYGNIITGAIEGVQALNDLGDVIAITARPKEAVHDTLVWLATMFDKAPLSGLVIQSFGQKKSEVIPPPGVYVDDALHNAMEILDNTSASVVLYDAPYNRNTTEDSSRLVRAHGWREVVEAVWKIKEAS